MITLGINWGDSSTVSLIKNNKIISAYGEERFSRIKNDMSYPYRAIKQCIKDLGKEKIDNVALGAKGYSYESILTNIYKLSVKDMIWLQNNYYHDLFYKNKNKSFLTTTKKFWKKNQYPKEYWKKVDKKKIKSFSDDVEKIVSNNLKIPRNKIFKVDHHTCHSNYAYYSSPFKTKKCLVFTMDGYGDGLNATISIGENGNLKRIYETDKCIVGRIYSHITLLLGMKRLEHEYKLMGLAPYGEKYFNKDCYGVFDEILKLNKYKFLINKKPKDSYFYFKKKLEGYRFDTIASSLQLWVENIIINWVLNAVEFTGIKYVCFSGGVGMNAKAMGKLLENKKIKSLWVPGAGQDDSTCIGAALEVQKNNSNKKNNFIDLKNLYFGNDANLDEANFLKNKINKKKFTLIKFSNKKAALFLSKGKILGRVVDRMEFGPRSLGNRSILADPRNLTTKTKINAKIKNRDFWMPFAPSIIDSCAKKYIFNSHKTISSHMALTFKTTKIGYQKIIAACHDADKTVRAQIVTKKTNLDYYSLIKEFKNITGCGALLNTSFNLHGYPVVKNISEAFDVLNKSDLDGLITKNFIIVKKQTN